MEQQQNFEPSGGKLMSLKQSIVEVLTKTECKKN